MGLLDFMQTPQGLGLLGAAAGGLAGARRGTPFNNVGRGLAAGLTAYQSANDQIRTNQNDELARRFQEMKMREIEAQVAQRRAMRESMNSLYRPAGTKPFEADNPFGEDLGTLQSATPPTFAGAAVDPIMAAVLPHAEPGDVLKMFSTGQNKTAEQKNWEYAQSLPEDQRDMFMRSNNSAPATVQEWEFFSRLPDDQRSAYLEMKRNPQIMNLGGTQAVRAPGGGIGESYTVTPKPTDMPDFQAAQEAAKVTARESSQRFAEAKGNLPKVQASAQFAREMVQGLLEHPGFSSTVGITAFPGFRFVPGTKEADFMSRFDQLKGTAFLQAFETLKGGGQITEVEGKKATDAINRMSISTSEAEFRAAAKDFLSVVDRAEKNAVSAAAKSIGSDINSGTDVPSGYAGGSRKKANALRADVLNRELQIARDTGDRQNEVNILNEMKRLGIKPVSANSGKSQTGGSTEGWGIIKVK